MKKILIINTTFSFGGAAKIARLFFEFLNRESSFETFFAYGRGPVINDSNVIKFGNDLEVLLHGFLTRFLGLEGMGSFFSTQKLIKFIKSQNFDIIHLHNLHGYYLNFFSLIKFLINEKYKVVWTLHDEWPITWMPAHSMGCYHCKTLIGKCHNKYPYPKTYCKVFARYMLEKKKEIFSNFSPTIVCPSKWLYEQIKNSFLREKRIELIYNGVDINIYKPLKNKDFLRTKYGIPKDKFVILVMGSRKKDPSKGIDFIKKVILKTQKNKNLIFIGVGNFNFYSTNFIKLGYIQDEKKLVEIYNISDVFLFLSLAETSPLSVLEAMACGLPVIAFNVGPINEFIDSRNGWIFNVGEEDKIESLLNILSTRKDLINFQKSSREKALNFSLDKMLKKYLEIYNNI